MQVIWGPRVCRATCVAAGVVLGGAAPAQRAADLVRRMSLDEKTGLLHGNVAFTQGAWRKPAGAIGSAGVVPGIPRLGIPALQETDGGLGIANPWNARPGDTAVALPSALALAAAFDPEAAYQAGALLGREAASRGFNVLLGPGANLARDPRGGRNFEYGSEDPLLAGITAGETARGIQDQHVIAVLKHFALNDQESGRQVLDARIDDAALRESDLLAFEIALERGRPGAVMCAYNRVNGPYACENPFLLNTVLKQDWKFPGFVISDWGAVHSAAAAADAGLDQESAVEFDPEPYFGAPLRNAVLQGAVPASRLDDMTDRVLATMAEAGLLEGRPRPVSDAPRDLEVARRAASDGMVVLKNDNDMLPLPRTLRHVLVVGGQADAGVLSGGGSSQVVPPGGFARQVALSGAGPEPFHTAFYDPPSPLSRIAAKLPGATVTYDDGTYPGRAAARAREADVALVFATQWSGEMQDIPDLALPSGQDATIAAIAAANPRTIVVLETAGAVLMPWRDRVAAILEAWYPGSSGADAIADVLFGDADPAGRLPVTFPAAMRQLPRTDVPGMYLPEGTPFTVTYNEGADAGYRWFARTGAAPLFPFGYGLSFARCEFANVAATGGRALSLSLDLRNTGRRPGNCVAEAYLTGRAGAKLRRLIGFAKRRIAPGETQHANIAADPRLLADFDIAGHRWTWPAGKYRVAVGASSGDDAVTATVDMAGGTAAP